VHAASTLLTDAHFPSHITIAPPRQLCPGSKVQRYVQCAASDTPDACKVSKGCEWSDSTAYDNSTLSYIIGEQWAL